MFTASPVEAPRRVGSQLDEAIFGYSMDLRKPSTTRDAPARDELAPSAESGMACDSADGGEAVGPFMGPLCLWEDKTNRFQSPLESTDAPRMVIISDGAGNVSAVNVPNNDAGNVSNHVPVADESMTLRYAKSSPMPVTYFSSRKQKRKANALRRKMQSQSGPPEPDAGSSRKRSLAMTADSSQTTEIKRTKMESHSEPPTNEKVAIIPVNFPAEQILQNHISAIQEAVITRLADAPDPLPRVICGALLGGALFFNCVGRDSVNWLTATIAERIIAGLNLKVVDAKDLPKPIKMAWKTKLVGVQDMKLVFRVLQRYNPGLNTDQWKVLDTSLDNMSSRRIILMDRASADVIRDAGYSLFSGMDISTFKLLEDSGGKNFDYGPRDAPGDPL